MGHRKAKKLRQEMRELHLDPGHRKYQIKVQYWLPSVRRPRAQWRGRGPVPVPTDYPVLGAFLWGYVVPVTQVRLHPACGRAVYRQAKRYQYAV